ncbi:MAG: ABC transporter permease [Bacteroidota bacterium]
MSNKCNQHGKSPPQWATQFLRWYCRSELLDEVEGDLYELFQRRVAITGLQKAKLCYWLNVFMFFQPDYIRKRRRYSTNHTAMLRHNFLIAFRNFQRYRSTFFINLIGLSSGLACALLIFLWVYDELSMDRFHVHSDRLYQVMEHLEQTKGLWTIPITSGPMAEALVDEMPEVEKAVTTTYMSSYTLSVDNTDITAAGLYASADYFNLFSYPLIQGDKNQVLSDKKAIVLSESLATSLFGTSGNVVGKTIVWQQEKQYQVSGVFEDIPSHSSTRPDFLLTFEAYRDDYKGVNEWGNIMPRAYLLMKKGADIERFNDKIADFVKVKTDGAIFHRTHFISPYVDQYLYNRYQNGVQTGGRIEYVRLFSVIAVFILLIACINFMNLSTARASRKTKEIGIKKAVGASRGSLIYQYLSESFLMALLSLVVAVLLVLLFLPSFNQITGKQLSLLWDVTLVASLLGIVSFTGLMAGSYPALYLSGFNPTTILKGKLNKAVGDAWARKGLVVFQFTLSIILMVSVWVVYQQILFVQTQSLGYEQDQIIFFRSGGLLKGEEGVPERQSPGHRLKTFLTEVKNIPGVVNASSSRHDLTGYHNSTGEIQWPGKDPTDKTAFEQVAANFGLIEVLGMDMQAGRSFSEDFGADTTKIIFNEAAIDFMGLTDPIGQMVQVNGSNKEIIGVVKDFHVASFREDIKPLFLYLDPPETDKVAVKIESGQEQKVLADLQQLYQAFNPSQDWHYWFLDEDYQSLYLAEQRVSVLSKYFAGLTILISCLGLFGLVAFTAERRLKEIGIRKILGASNVSIVQLLSGDFTRMVLGAIFLGLPISYFIAYQWLEGFVYRIDLVWWYFAGAGMVALLIAWLTVGSQTIKAARVNPVQCLKDE